MLASAVGVLRGEAHKRSAERSLCPTTTKAKRVVIVGYNLESVLNFIEQVNSLLRKIVSASLRLFSASIHFGDLKIARYYLLLQNEYLLENSPQIISK